MNTQRAKAFFFEKISMQFQFFLRWLTVLLPSNGFYPAKATPSNEQLPLLNLPRHPAQHFITGLAQENVI